MAGDFAIFFGLGLLKPVHMAAASPSGGRLADAVARLVDLTQPGPILDIGLWRNVLPAQLSSYARR